MMSYEAIAKKLGLTVEDVIEAERTGICKCVEWCRNHDIDPYDLIPRRFVEYHTSELFLYLEDD